MSDFFGEYVAPGFLFGGLGVAAYRTARDMRGRGIVSNRWSALSDQKSFLASFKAEQAQRYSVAKNVDELAGMFFPNTSRFRNLPEVATEEARDAFRKIREMTVGNLIRSFDLGPQKTRFGISNPGDISRTQLRELLALSPEHARHMERLAGNFSLNKLINLDSVDSITNTKLEEGARRAFSEILEIGKNFSQGTSLEEFMRASGAAGQFSIGRNARFVGVSSEAQLIQAMTDAGRPKELISESVSLFQRVRATKDLRLQLKILDEGAGDALVGLRIEGNKAISGLDIPHVLGDGTVRVGHFGTRKMIARNVLVPNAAEVVSRGSLAFHEPVDMALTRHLVEEFDSFTGTGKFKWQRLLSKITHSSREDVGKVLLPFTANPALNAKLSRQITMKNVPFRGAASDTLVSAIDNLILSKNYDAWAGISPTQRQAGVRLSPTKGRHYGVGALGTATGDDKTLAQNLRPKVIVGRQGRTRGRSLLTGVAQRQMGDIQQKLRTYAMPQVALETMLTRGGRRDLGLHEDVALLLDKNIRYGEIESIRVGGGGQLSDFMTEVMSSEKYAAFREAARSPIGVSGTIASLRESMIAADPESRKAIKASIDSLRAAATLTPDHILGIGASGNIVRGASGGSFVVDKINWVDNASGVGRAGASELIIEGMKEDSLKMGDKIFGMKRTLQEMDALEGQFFASLYEATKDRDDVRAAIAAGDKNALGTIYDPIIEELDASIKLHGGDFSLRRFTPTGIDPGRWAEAMRTTQGLQILDTQGFKKIGERTLPLATEALIEEITREHALTTARISRLVGTDSSPERFAQIMEKNPALKEKFSSLTASMARLGVTPMFEENNLFLQGFSIDDTLATESADSAQNLANRFDRVLLETMEEGNPHGLRRWSGQRAFSELASWSDEKYQTNLRISADMVNEHRARYAELAAQSEDVVRSTVERMLSNKTDREALIYGAQPQLQFGAYNRVAAIGGDSRKVLGMGGRGSFSIGMYRHMKHQGGVMSELGLSLAGRLTGEKTAEAEELARRVLAFEKGVGKDFKTISMAAFAETKFAEPEYLEQVFGRNQESRSRVFDEIRQEFGLEKSDNLVFDLGENRHLYHGESIGKFSAPFALPDGTQIESGLDIASKSIIEGFKVKDVGRINEGIEDYRTALTEVSFGKDKSLTRFLSGETLGSRRLQSAPALSADFIDFINAQYHHKVGLSESNFKSMLAEMGSVTDFDDRLGLLRRGSEALVVARNPATELHRITSVEAFSLDEAYRQFEERVVKNRTNAELGEALFSLSRKRYVDTLRRFKNDSQIQEEIKQQVLERRERLVSQRAQELAAIEVNHPGQSKIAKKTRRRLAQQVKGRYAKDLTSDSWVKERVELEMATRERDIWTEAISREMSGRIDDAAVLLPKHLESLLGADYDADPIDVFLAKSGSQATRLRERAHYRTQLIAAGDLNSMAGVDIDARIQDAFAGAVLPEEKLAAEDFAYTLRQKQLFSSLKDKPGGVLAAEDLTTGTPAWRRRQSGSALMAELEKGAIGPMTNATDFVREVLRTQEGAQFADGKIFSELLLGIMPETALKARQIGALRLEEAINGLGESVGGSIKTLQSILSGSEVGRMSRDQMTENFWRAFKNVHDPEGRSAVVERMREFVPRVIDAVGAGKRPENLYAKFLKRTDDSVSLGGLAEALTDTTAPWVQGQIGQEAAQALKIDLAGPTKTNLKLAQNTFADVVGIMKSHRRPALVGAGLAIGTALLLGSPGSISAEEADSAGARRDLSAPTPEPPGFPEAPVSTDGGRSIRIRARSSGDVDTSRISSLMQSRFGGADISYTMNDLRTRINEEFVRKQLERG